MLTQAIAQAEAELAQLTALGEESTVESVSPALTPDERTIALPQQIEQWRQLLEKLGVTVAD